MRSVASSSAAPRCRGAEGGGKRWGRSVEGQGARASQKQQQGTGIVGACLPPPSQPASASRHCTPSTTEEYTAVQGSTSQLTLVLVGIGVVEQRLLHIHRGVLQALVQHIPAGRGRQGRQAFSHAQSVNGPHSGGTCAGTSLQAGSHTGGCSTHTASAEQV
jgi:hypothetical protein